MFNIVRVEHRREEVSRSSMKHENLMQKAPNQSQHSSAEAVRVVTCFLIRRSLLVDRKGPGAMQQSGSRTCLTPGRHSLPIAETANRT